MGKELCIGLTDQWESIRKLSQQIIIPLTKLRYFQYKVLSVKLVTNFHRNKWKPEVSPLCNFCKEHANVTSHVLYDCAIMTKLWHALTKWLSYMLKCNIVFDKPTVILNNYRGQHKELMNAIILIVNYYFYAQSCKNKMVNFPQLISRITKHRTIEFTVHNKMQMMAKYYKKWGLLD